MSKKCQIINDLFFPVKVMLGIMQKLVNEAAGIGFEKFEV